MSTTTIRNAQLLVTGASRGIGRALVEEALARGAARIYAGVRDPAALADLVAKYPDRIVPLVIDLTRPETIAAAKTRVEALDLLVNNAGLLSSGSLLGDSLESIERDMRTNYFGTLAVSRAFLPAVEKRGGAIANVLTVAALASMPPLGAYSASKAASFSLTQGLRGELAKRGVRVHAVFPGPVDTEMAKEVALPKTPADVVARAILDGVEQGVPDIFPDPMARQVGELWQKAPRELEKMFAAM